MDTDERIEMKTSEQQKHEQTMNEYRLQVRKTFQQFSDHALAFQDARIIGGIDREECDREINRRRKEA